MPTETAGNVSSSATATGSATPNIFDLINSAAHLDASASIASTSAGPTLSAKLDKGDDPKLSSLLSQASPSKKARAATSTAGDDDESMVSSVEMDGDDDNMILTA